MHVLCIRLYVAIVLLLVCTLAGCNVSPPPGVRIYPRSLNVKVQHDDDPVWDKPGYQICVLVRCDSDKTIVALSEVERPFFRGPGGAVRHEKTVSNVISFLGQKQPSIDFPVDDKIEAYVVLVRKVKTQEQQASWREWDVAVADIGKKATIVLPRIDGLKDLTEREDHDKILKTIDGARSFREEF